MMQLYFSEYISNKIFISPRGYFNMIIYLNFIIRFIYYRIVNDEIEGSQNFVRPMVQNKKSIELIKKSFTDSDELNFKRRLRTIL